MDRFKSTGCRKQVKSTECSGQVSKQCVATGSSQQGAEDRFSQQGAENIEYISQQGAEDMFWSTTGLVNKEQSIQDKSAMCRGQVLVNIGCFEYVFLNGVRWTQMFS